MHPFDDGNITSIDVADVVLFDLVACPARNGCILHCARP